MEEERQISRNNFDIFFRTSLQKVFQHDTLASIGIHTAPVIRALPTDIPAIRTTDQRVDALFELKDATLLHIEFQTVASTDDDLIRFMEYSTHIYKKYRKLCHTCIVCGAEVQKAPDSLRVNSISHYSVQNIYLALLDGDSLFHLLKERIQSGKTITAIEEMQLTLLPLMFSKQKKRERALRVADLALELSEEEQQARIIASLLVVTNKWLDESDARIYLRRLKNMKVIDLAFEEGKEEGLQEGLQKRSIETALDLLRDGMSPEKVARYTRLSEERVMELKKEL